MYNENQVEVVPIAIKAHEESICNKETSSLESILQDVLPSQLTSEEHSQKRQTENSERNQAAAIIHRTVTSP